MTGSFVFISHFCVFYLRFDLPLRICVGRDVCARAMHVRGGETLAHTRAQSGSTALIYAALYGRMDCARLLLDAGADTEATNVVRASQFA